MANKNTKGKNHQTMMIAGNDNEALKLFKIFLILIVCFFIFYAITYYVTENMSHTSEGNGNSENRIASIQYDQILVGTMLKQKRDSYYVFLDKPSIQEHSLYLSFLTTYAEKENALKVYTIDMEEPLNKNHFTEKSNLTNELSDFTVNKETLIKIENGKIKDTYVGYDSVLKKLKEMTK